MVACLALFGIFGIYQYTQHQKSQEQIARVKAELVEFRTKCESSQQALHDMERQLAFYQHRQTAPLQLNGTDLAPGSRVRVLTPTWTGCRD